MGALVLLRPHPVAGQGELNVGSLTFRYWPGGEEAARALARSSQGRLDTWPGLPADVLSGGEIVIYLAPSSEVFDSLAPDVPDWSGGIAFPQGDVIVLPLFAPRMGRQAMTTVLRHELAHVALDRYLGSGVPRWFHEGYAQLAAGSWSSGDAWALRVAILLGEPSLGSLNLEFGKGRVSADHAYLLSYTVVEYLRRLGGVDGFERLLERWRDLGDLDRALRRTYGVTLGQFERMWKRDVTQRFGWLLLLGQTAVFWSILTVLLLVLGYWKRRRSRRKLEALEAAVADAEAWSGEGEGGLGAGRRAGIPGEERPG